MLEAIRKRSASMLVKLLLALLILAFAAWGIEDVFTGLSRPGPVAEVGEMEITRESLEAEIQRELQNLRKTLGPDFDTSILESAGLANIVLKRMVDRALFTQAAKSMGVAVPESAAATAIRNNPDFFNQFGKFDRSVFENLMYTNRWTEPQYIELLKGDMARGQVLESVIAGGTAPNALVEGVVRHREQRRVAEIVTIPDAETADPGSPDMKTLAAFHAENGEKYMAPEYRGLTAIHLDASDLAAEMSISEDELKEAFELHAGRFRIPERRGVKQMLFFSQETAAKALEMLKEGASFDEVGKEHAGLDPDAMSLGMVTRDQMLAELADAAFSVPLGGFTDPLPSPLGWHILQVTSLEPGREPDFQQDRAAVETEVRMEKAVNSLYDMSNRVEDALAGRAPLEEVADQFNLRLIKVDAVALDGTGPDGRPVDGLPGGDRFLQTAFATQSGEESLLTETGEDGYFVVRVDGVQPSELKPLATVAAEVEADWKRVQATRAAEAAAKLMVEKLKSGQAGEDASRVGPFTRKGDGVAGEMPLDLVAAMFKADVGGVAMARGDDGFVVGRLAEIIEADPASDPTMIEAVKSQLAGAIRSDLIAQFSEGLRARYPISIDQSAIGRMYQPR